MIATSVITITDIYDIIRPVTINESYGQFLSQK